MSDFKNKLPFAQYLRYNATGNQYSLEAHNLNIKTESGNWEVGCLYRDLVSQELYARAYSMFKEDSWHVLNKSEVSSGLR